MEHLIFEVQGSATEPYRVRFEHPAEGVLRAFCNCAAGDNGQYCKHRINILDGSRKGIVSDNAGKVEEVQSWFAGTELESMLKSVQQMESESAALKKKVVALKKRVAKEMLGN